MGFANILQVIAILVAAAGIYLGLRGVRKQLWVAVFNQYTQRYENIVSSLPRSARSPFSNIELDTLDDDERQQTLNAMRRYLNLCSEEMYLANSGYVDKKAWGIWKTGIRDTVRLPFFSEAWDILGPEYLFYPDFQEFINKMISESKPQSS